MAARTFYVPDALPETPSGARDTEIQIVRPRVTESIGHEHKLRLAANSYEEALFTFSCPQLQAVCYTDAPDGETQWRATWNAIENCWEPWEVV